MKKSLFYIITSMFILCVLVFFASRLYINWRLSHPKAMSKEMMLDDHVYEVSEKQILYDEVSAVKYVKNTLLVYLNDDLPSNERLEIVKSNNGILVGQLKGSINVLEINVEANSLVELEMLANNIMIDPRVMYATYDAIVDASYESDFVEHVERNVAENSKWWMEAIGVDRAWERLEEVRNISYFPVGIIDNGFHDGHEDLKRKIKRLPNSGLQDLSHGTHVAGIIGALNNGVGIRGISDESKLLCYGKAKIGEGDDMMQLLAPIKDAIDQGARVINCSWGVKNLTYEQFLDVQKEDYHGFKDAVTFYFGEKILEQTYDEYVRFVDAAIENSGLAAILLSMQLEKSGNDYIIVHSAGNDNINAVKNGWWSRIDSEFYNRYSSHINNAISYEDIRKHILVVASVERESGNGGYSLCDFSSYGKNVDIVAPGRNIYSTVSPRDPFEKGSNIFNSPLYDFSDGTSMSAPMVTGAANLIWSIDPSLSSKEVKEHLINTSSYVASNKPEDPEGFTYRMLNVEKAVNGLLGPIKPILAEEKDDEDEEVVGNNFDLRKLLGMFDNYDAESTQEEFWLTFNDDYTLDGTIGGREDFKGKYSIENGVIKGYFAIDSIYNNATGQYEEPINDTKYSFEATLEDKIGDIILYLTYHDEYGDYEYILHKDCLGECEVSTDDVLSNYDQEENAYSSITYGVYDNYCKVQNEQEKIRIRFNTDYTLEGWLADEKFHFRGNYQYDGFNPVTGTYVIDRYYDNSLGEWVNEPNLIERRFEASLHFTGSEAIFKCEDGNGEAEYELWQHIDGFIEETFVDTRVVVPNSDIGGVKYIKFLKDGTLVGLYGGSTEYKMDGEYTVQDISIQHSGDRVVGRFTVHGTFRGDESYEFIGYLNNHKIKSMDLHYNKLDINNNKSLISQIDQLRNPRFMDSRYSEWID